MPAEAPGKTVELLVALKAVPPFSELPPEDLALLVERATTREFEPGQVVIARGSTVEAIHVVIDGTLVEERSGQAWARREPYEIVGGVDALAGSSTELEVRAEAPTRTLELERETLLEVCHDRFDVLNAIATGVAGMAIAARLRLGAAAGFGAPARAPAPAGAERPPGRLDLAERVAFLRTLPVLHDVAMLTLAEVAAQSERVTFAAGETLWRTGDRADHVLLVVSGTIDCAAGDGIRFAFGPREAAGVLDALAEVPRWYDATARTRLVALRARLADVLDVLEDDPATAVAGLTSLARATSNLVTVVSAS
jgi:CRP-like cAMP-binding protein